MNTLLTLGLLIGLNLYIRFVIFLSKKKRVWLGLIFPLMMNMISILSLSQVIHVYKAQVNVMICSLILAIFSFILFIVVRYGDAQGIEVNE